LQKQSYDFFLYYAMNIILFSRKQVNHNPQQLKTLFDTMQRLGLDYSINEDFATVVEGLLGIVIPRTKRYDGYAPATQGDVMIPYGGDGTLLEAVQLLPKGDIPVVGINCGRLGYLTADNGDGIEDLLERIAVGNISYQRRDMIAIAGDVMCGGKCLALNEVAIHRHGATMISIETFVDDNRIATYHGDGLVVSTPTGSTAYSLSAGGPVVDPLCNCFILSPIAPHNLTMRPIVVPNNISITLRLHSRGGEAFLSADNRTYSLCDGATIRLQRAEEQLILATPHNNTFYDTLREKMMWGVDSR
jgi:NAD+ kinase